MTHILVTNDDGVTAPGLLALVAELRTVGEVSVLAPDRNWSASGHQKTLQRPLRVKEINLQDGSPALACDGTPADCVVLAALGLVPEIDLVVSGINPNSNLGHDVTYSGTVAAAKEAVIWGLPGLAVSVEGQSKRLTLDDFQPAAETAREVAELMLTRSLPADIVLNLNVPGLPGSEIKGLQVTRQGLRVYHDELLIRSDPREVPYYWIGGDPPSGVPDPGTDVGALKAGYASLTPLTLDLTAESALSPLESIIDET